MLLIAVVDHSSSGWQFPCTEETINSVVVVAGILISFSVAGVVGVGTTIKAPS